MTFHTEENPSTTLPSSPNTSKNSISTLPQTSTHVSANTNVSPTMKSEQDTTTPTSDVTSGSSLPATSNMMSTSPKTTQYIVAAVLTVTIMAIVIFLCFLVFFFLSKHRSKSRHVYHTSKLLILFSPSWSKHTVYYYSLILHYFIVWDGLML